MISASAFFIAVLKAGDDFGVFGGEVGGFGEVFCEIEKGGFLFVGGADVEEFPVVDADAVEFSFGAVVEELVAGGRFVGENCLGSVQAVDFMFKGEFGFGDGGEGGKEVEG